MRGRPLFLLFFVAIAACVSKHSGVLNPDHSVKLTVDIPELTLRAAPGENSKVIRQLNKGDTLTDLEEVSTFTTSLRMHGVQMDEPWLKVATADGVSGWVYAGGIQWLPGDTSSTSQIIFSKRLQTLFGIPLEKEITGYRQRYETIHTAEEFAGVYRTGIKLRDTLVHILAQRIVTDNEEANRPDLFWIKTVFPAFQPQLVSEGTAYYLFSDYRQWLAKAKASPEMTDDELANLYIAAFPEDSIEYFFPIWSIQTTDYTGQSLLGRGHHKALLQKANALYEKNPLFRPELLEFKSRIVNDITKASVTYWETQEKILRELDGILQADLGILSNADRIALATRRKQFADPESYGIELNGQAGNQ